MTNIYNTPTETTAIVNPAGNIIVDPNIPDYVSPLDVDLLKFRPTLPPIDYSNLDFSAIKLQLINFLGANASKFGYSIRDFGDSNTAGMMLNLMSHMGQMLSYHMDSMVNELFLDTAQSSWSTYRLLNMFKYKPSRPKAGVLLLNLTRFASTANSATTAAYEDSSEIILSPSLSRRTITLGQESFELFPIKINSLGVLEPDYLSDLVIPPYVFAEVSDPDPAMVETALNSYTCFALTGSTRVEDFISNGSQNQIVTLTSSPILDSDIIVQVQDTSISIPGKVAYNTWTEIPYISLAGFASPATIQEASTDTPYLIAPIMLSSIALSQKNNGVLLPGMLMQIDYDNVASIANFADFIPLTVPYRLGIISSVTSQINPNDSYIDLIIFHPSYVYGSTGGYTILPTTFKDTFGNDVSWSSGDILYLLAGKTLNIPGIGNVKQPQMISDTQLLSVDGSKYPDVAYLQANPSAKIAVGRVMDASTSIIALGISAEIETTYYSEPVFETSWDGNFQGQVRFGDNNFGKIPENNTAIKVIYRTNSTNNTGYVVSINEANQSLSYGHVSLEISNTISSAPSTIGETIATSKELVTRFYTSQDRAIVGEDYLLLAKRFNSNYKLAVALTKAEADASIVRLYALSIAANTTSTTSASTSVSSIAPLTVTEKYQLRNYLNTYKPIGTAVEIVDGVVRKLDIRVDARVKSGYLTGQVKQDIISTTINFFNLNNTDLGIGLKAASLVKTLNAVSGISSADVYLGGITTVTLPNSVEIISGTKTFTPIKDIPGYQDTSQEFPTLSTSYDISSSLLNSIAPYEIIILDTLEVNIISI
ncbi:MAG: hypothetical protein JHC33_05150 [Ignisphaera sp.]|nr:hypothetical protein [Ignisphaera sp.]